MSELLNIWREFGSYNRYGETKNSLFFGLLIALGSLAIHDPPSFLGFFLILGGNKFVFDASIVLSGLVCLLSFFPILKIPSILLFKHQNQSQSLNPYYFFDVATYPSAEDWLKRLKPDVSPADIDRADCLANQIWIIARIARRKFALLRVAILVLFGGWLLSWAIQLAARIFEEVVK